MTSQVFNTGGLSYHVFGKGPAACILAHPAYTVEAYIN